MNPHNTDIEEATELLYWESEPGPLAPRIRMLLDEIDRLRALAGLPPRVEPGEKPPAEGSHWATVPCGDCGAERVHSATMSPMTDGWVCSRWWRDGYHDRPKPPAEGCGQCDWNREACKTCAPPGWAWLS